MQSRSLSILHSRTLIIAMLVGGSVAQEQATLIVAGGLFDPVSGEVRANQRILVEGDRIRAVGGSVLAPAGARTVDLSQMIVLPGLIDAHVHLGIGGPVRANAAATLDAGFTTVLDLGARTTRLLRIRDSINAGHIEGPRVLAAGIWIGTKNGVCEFGGIGLDGVDAFRARVRENVAAGADVIKVCVTGWPAQTHAAPDAYEISDAALAAVVEEARSERRMVIAHDLSRGGVRAGLQAGISGLAHAAYVDSTLAIGLRDAGIFMIPTIATLAPDESAASMDLRRAVALANRQGVELVFGTDGGVLPHGRKVDEFVALTAAGIPPLAALRTATIYAARRLGLADSVGTIAPGMIADLVAVQGNPLKDMRAIGDVRFVMLRGRVVRQRTESR